jgi:hypothetical protein
MNKFIVFLQNYSPLKSFIIMKKAHLIIITALAVIFFATSCKKEIVDDHADVPTGRLMGQVFAENGTTPLPSVNVFVDYEGEIYLTQTNKDGKFSFDVPAGKQVLHIQSGTGRIFRTHIEVDVEEGAPNTIPNGVVKLSQSANLAYIPGAFDRIEAIIIDSLGYTATQLQLNDLSNLTTLENYSAIFLNCGKPGPLDSLHYVNLEAYVMGGGSIYVSDFAVEYIIGDNQLYSAQLDRSRLHELMGFEKNCPPRTGGFIDVNDLCTQKQGLVTTITNAAILDTALQVYLNKTTVDIEYDLGGWEVIEVLGSSWDILVQDNTFGYGPLAVRRALNPTNKSIQNMAQQNWITICHIPPGNPNNPITITIPISAWPAHQAHGDYLGPCIGTGGQILFTTFHNHAYHHADIDIQKMLEYFILSF